MKRIGFVLMLVSILGLTNSFAQEEGNKISIGVHGNSGLSWMSTQTSDYESEGAKFSYGFGAKLDYRFAKNYYIGSGFDINFVGGKLLYPYQNISLNSSNVLDTNYGIMHRNYDIKYLDIPLNLTLKTKEIGYFTYFVQLGFVGSFRLTSYANDKFDYIENGVDKNEPLDNIDIKNDYGFMRAGFNVGLGTEFNLNNSISFYGKVLFTNGATDVLRGTNMVKNSKGVFETIEEEAFLNNIGISVGVLF